VNSLALSFISTVIIGLGATLTLDLWTLFLQYAFKATPSSICLVGRWFRTMPEGIFKHPNIASSPQKGAECTVGWIVHYMVGVLFSLAFLALAGSHWLERPTLIPAVSFGAVTVLVPFFIMQPAFGLGLAAAKTSKPAQARLRSLMNHTVFGIGLYLFGLLGSWLL
jgi:hypothetical protein